MWAVAAKMSLPPALESEFELVEELPAGKVFHLYHVKDMRKGGADAVVRLFPEKFASDQSLVDRFHSFFTRFGDISNRAFIPAVYSVSGQPGGHVYVLEEHVSGIDLTTFVTANQCNSGFNREIIGIVGKVCEALHHAHQKDIFHLAITPEDILIDEKTGRVKLVGFGVQVFAQANKIGLLSAQARKTIAPEILTGSLFKPNADVYSLAKIINDICPEVFSRSDVLFKALSNNPDDRYQTARDFEGSLNDVLERISKPVRSKNIDTPVEAKGGLKPVFNEKPVTVERDVYQPSPRKVDTPQSQPQLRPDQVPSKSISMKLVAAIAAGVLALVIGLAVYSYYTKQILEKDREITELKEAEKKAALEKQEQEAKQREIEAQNRLGPQAACERCQRKVNGECRWCYQDDMRCNNQGECVER
jgi:serine/threonine protein kinase